MRWGEQASHEARGPGPQQRACCRVRNTLVLDQVCSQMQCGCQLGCSHPGYCLERGEEILGLLHDYVLVTGAQELAAPESLLVCPPGLSGSPSTGVSRGPEHLRSRVLHAQTLLQGTKKEEEAAK